MGQKVNPIGFRIGATAPGTRVGTPIRNTAACFMRMSNS